MEFKDNFGGTLAKHLDSQMHSILDCEAKDSFVKYTFALPGNSRFSYADKEYIAHEMQKTLDKYYPLGSRIAYITSTPNDDHYIEVGVLVRC